ncbi:hypothetical protein EJ913_26840 [Azospirillum doebereinerae]|uniref:Uncharacterized protein n=1 Tax=Azospirillum doebereinerae TaxID=92933 RepID=A0A3S1CDS9_9PROT|nr:hypothetical protein EJ913_26840 [Azospirillum doebereinerae]
MVIVLYGDLATMLSFAAHTKKPDLSRETGLSCDPALPERATCRCFNAPDPAKPHSTTPPCQSAAVVGQHHRHRQLVGPSVAWAGGSGIAE